MAMDTQSTLPELVVAFVRAFGLHQPDRTPCGQPVAVSEAHALMELADGAVLTQKELAARLQLDKSTVSRLVGQLAARGWVERARDASDGRAVRVQLTAAGAEATGRLSEARADRFARLLAAIPPEERPRVLDGLSALVRASRVSRGPAWASTPASGSEIRTGHG